MSWTLKPGNLLCSFFLRLQSLVPATQTPRAAKSTPAWKHSPLPSPLPGFRFCSWPPHAASFYAKILLRPYFSFWRGLSWSAAPPDGGLVFTLCPCHTKQSIWTLSSLRIPTFTCVIYYSQPRMHAPGKKRILPFFPMQCSVLSWYFVDVQPLAVSTYVYIVIFLLITTHYRTLVMQ